MKERKTLNFKQNYLVIELTNSCILRCNHCIQKFSNHKHFKKKGFIERGLITKMIKDLKRSNMKFDAIVLFWLGEPLLHPQFKDIYREILSETRKNNLFNKVEVHTNGYLLDDEIMSIALEYKDVVQRWHFSLDAASRATYRKIKHRDYYDVVLKKIKRFVKEKNEKKSKYPQFVFQFIIEKENYKEARLFSEFWQNYLKSLGMRCRVYGHFVPTLDKDCVFFRQLDCLNRKYQEKADKMYKEVLTKIKLDTLLWFTLLKPKCASTKMNICSGPWKSAVIGWDGNVTVCTNDSEMQLGIGNIKKEDFGKIWWANKKVELLRKRLLKNELSGLICCECTIPKSNNYTGITKEELKLCGEMMNDG